MTDEADQKQRGDRHEGRLHRIGREVEEEVDHLLDELRGRAKAAELGAMEGSPSSILATKDALEGAIDPEHEPDRVADETEPHPPKPGDG